MICSASITIKSSKKHVPLKCWARKAQTAVAFQAGQPWAGRRYGNRGMLCYNVCSPAPRPWVPGLMATAAWRSPTSLALCCVVTSTKPVTLEAPQPKTGYLDLIATSC